ncbi:hypothetical protein PGT21_002022 [Puccinia graminis f. sp. tritici]|uniref:Uncharacterized protein n=2 Tax=Puccinia graminis f. sp. tritici TaxID=56615 RepID=E3L271_PUCGT|nr:uncharacterized protein PGTG_16672 [Puccinia graminis f. sp. tritici CRL 75-36-700-3]EFP90646.2 hypothetical protein PGTG_16672 [Puccinia graminis f. sp. tritici CRL 75-36-700-3]KAA1108149.1 hypothetical protein PGT21_002022 [Puccinia graminis f. sp. tritici]
MVSLSQPLVSSNTAKNFVLEGRSHWPVGESAPSSLHGRQSSKAQEAKVTKEKPFKRLSIEMRDLAQFV